MFEIRVAEIKYYFMKKIHRKIDIENGNTSYRFSYANFVIGSFASAQKTLIERIVYCKVPVTSSNIKLCSEWSCDWVHFRIFFFSCIFVCRLSIYIFHSGFVPPFGICGTYLITFFVTKDLSNSCAIVFRSQCALAKNTLWFPLWIWSIKSIIIFLHFTIK